MGTSHTHTHTHTFANRGGDLWQAVDELYGLPAGEVGHERPVPRRVLLQATHGISPSPATPSWLTPALALGPGARTEPALPSCRCAALSCCQAPRRRTWSAAAERGECVVCLHQRPPVLTRLMSLDTCSTSKSFALADPAIISTSTPSYLSLVGATWSKAFTGARAK